MRVIIQELEELLMDSCREARPDAESLGALISDVNSMNMFDFWRDQQLFYMSCLAAMQYGTGDAVPDQLVETRFLKQNDEPELYTLVSTHTEWDGAWFEYMYDNSAAFGKPSDDGEMFYNSLSDETIDKFQVAYNWDGHTFKKDSLFIGNISAPIDEGEVNYRYNKNYSVTKTSLQYVFQEDRFIPLDYTTELFMPPADNGVESCLDK